MNSKLNFLKWGALWFGLFFFLGVFGVMALGAGCGAVPTCDTSSSNGICTEYATTEAAEAACSASSATASTSGCPTTNRVGYCVVTSSGVTTTYHYYSSTFTASSAESTCSGLTGTFTAD